MRGGGVFIACKRYLHTEPISIANNDLEQIFICVEGASRDIIIGRVFIPPQSPSAIFYNYLVTL